MSKVIKDGEQDVIVYTEEEYKELETKYTDLVTKNSELEGKYNELIESGRELPETPSADEQFKQLFPELYK